MDKKEQFNEAYRRYVDSGVMDNDIGEGVYYIVDNVVSYLKMSNNKSYKFSIIKSDVVFYCLYEIERNRNRFVKSPYNLFYTTVLIKMNKLIYQRMSSEYSRDAFGCSLMYKDGSYKYKRANIINIESLKDE